ncbi:MAG: hypothetical protein H5T71_09035 [Chloroflexi bacterium]|nr:hypothetical protein [Chloroflexota bacterium]
MPRVRRAGRPARAAGAADVVAVPELRDRLLDGGPGGGAEPGEPLGKVGGRRCAAGTTRSCAPAGASPG